MKSMIDRRAFLFTTAVSVGLSVGASPILYFDIGPTRVLHALIYFPLCIASGAFYVGITVKRRPDLSITSLSLGGGLTAILPAFILTVADTSFVLAPVFAAFGAVLGCIGAVVYAMWDDARFLRRNQQSDAPRPLPRSRRR